MALEPELDRIGVALTRAAARHRTRAERRRRLAGSIAAGLLVFAAMTPSSLGRADRPALPDILRFAVTTSAAAAELCDRPRGPRFDVEQTCADVPAPQALR